jgi:hypothetical protein
MGRCDGSSVCDVMRRFGTTIGVALPCRFRRRGALALRGFVPQSNQTTLSSRGHRAGLSDKPSLPCVFPCRVTSSLYRDRCVLPAHVAPHRLLAEQHAELPADFVQFRGSVPRVLPSTFAPLNRIVQRSRSSCAFAGMVLDADRTTPCPSAMPVGPLTEVMQCHYRPTTFGSCVLAALIAERYRGFIHAQALCSCAWTAATRCEETPYFPKRPRLRRK